MLKMLPRISRRRIFCMFFVLVSSTSALDVAQPTAVNEKQVIHSNQEKRIQVDPSSQKQLSGDKPQAVLTAESVNPLVEKILSSMMEASNTTKDALVNEISQKILSSNKFLIQSPQVLEDNHGLRVRRSKDVHAAEQRQSQSSIALPKLMAPKPNTQSGSLKTGVSAEPISPPDISQIKYLINNNVCQSNSRFNTPITAVVLVTSHIGNQDKRDRMRKAFPAELIEKLGFRRVFVLATLRNASESDPRYKSITQNEILKESKTNADILQIDIIEAHKNLTHKNLMGLQWASSYCNKARFIVKSDDDVIMDYYQMVDDLANVKKEDKNALIGRVWKDNHPSRDSSYVYYVSHEEYPAELYPEYLSGFIFVTSPESARKLVLTSKLVPYLKIDDVYITGMVAAKAGLKRVDAGNKYTYKSTIRCCHDKAGVLYKCESIAGLNYLDDSDILDKIRAHSELCHHSQKCKDLSEAKNLDELICF